MPIDWWWIVAGFLLFVTPLGRMGIAVLGRADCWSAILQPGTYRRGGPVHLRVWLAERLAEASGAENLAGAPWLVYYARALGNKVGKGVDLHSAPPVTGMLTLGHRCSIEPEVDLTGHWIDGDLFHVGPDHRRRRRHDRRPHHAAARRGGRQERRRRARLRRRRQGEERPVLEGLARGEVRQGHAIRGPTTGRPGRRVWVAMYGVTSVLLGALPLVALAAGLAVLGWAVRDTGVAGRGGRCLR